MGSTMPDVHVRLDTASSLLLVLVCFAGSVSASAGLKGLMRNQQSSAGKASD